MDTLFFIIELIGVMAFALSGALTAIKKELDVVGVIVVAIIASLGGGLIRDIVLGINPPNMFVNPTYYIYETVAVSIGFFAFIGAYLISRYKWRMPKYSLMLNIADAMGLAVFCVFGAKLAVDNGFGEYKLLLVFVGVISGVGGGATRDVLVGEIPIIFRKYVYATPSIIGTMIYVLTYEHLPEALSIILPVMIIFSIRVLAIIFKWDLPAIKKDKPELLK